MTVYRLNLKKGGTPRSVGLKLGMSPPVEGGVTIEVLPEPVVPPVPYIVVFTPGSFTTANDSFSRVLTEAHSATTTVTITTIPPGGLVKATKDGSDPATSLTSRLYNTAKAEPQTISFSGPRILRGIVVSPGVSPEAKATYPYYLPKGGLIIWSESPFGNVGQAFRRGMGLEYYWGDQVQFTPGLSDADFAFLGFTADFTGLDQWTFSITGGASGVLVGGSFGNSFPYQPLPADSPTSITLLAGTTTPDVYPWVTNPNGPNTITGVQGVIDPPQLEMMPYMDGTFQQGLYIAHPTGINTTDVASNNAVPPGASVLYGEGTPANPQPATPTPTTPYPGVLGDPHSTIPLVATGDYRTSGGGLSNTISAVISKGGWNQTHFFSDIFSANRNPESAPGPALVNFFWPRFRLGGTTVADFFFGTSPNNPPLRTVGLPVDTVFNNVAGSRATNCRYLTFANIEVATTPATLHSPRYDLVAKSWTIHAWAEGIAQTDSLNDICISTGFYLWKGHKPPYTDGSILNAPGIERYLEHTSFLGFFAGDSAAVGTIALGADLDWFTVAVEIDMNLITTVAKGVMIYMT